MLDTPVYAWDDLEGIAALVRDHPWAVVVSVADGQPVVSHTPILLDAEATWDVLVRTVERFEDERPAPWSLDRSLDYARRIAPGTVGFRLTTERIEAKAKLSQDKPDEVIRSVVQALETDPVHGQPELADTMRAHVPHLFAEDRA